MNAHETKRHDANTPPSGACLALIEQLYGDLEEGVVSCSNPNRVFAFGWHVSRDRVITYRPDCKLWSCPACAIKNRKRWIARVAHGANQLALRGEALTFITLSHNRYDTIEKAWSESTSRWTKLYARMKRTCPDMQYVIVPELHKSGKPHWHILTDFESPETYREVIDGKRITTKNTRVKAKGDRKMWKWFKDVPHACGFGYMNDAQELGRNVIQAAAYVSKYLAKNTGENSLPEGTRRIRVSQNFPDLPELERDYLAQEYDWIIAHTADEAARIIEKAHNMRATVIHAHTGEIVF